MSTLTQRLKKQEIVYPESDGLPLADNTTQFRWITTIKGGLDAVFFDEPKVFVAGNLLWYPIKGKNKLRVAPDVFVAFGRPKGERGSYQQWVEGNIAPQVVFEIVSPGNTAALLTEKFDFYDKYKVEEYYLYDPDRGELAGWIRKGKRLTKIDDMNGWTSPRLGVRFEMPHGELRLFDPTGVEILTYGEVVKQRESERLAKEKAIREREQEHKRVERLQAQLKALGIEPEA
ncbi:MAG TPA: Uma2 family endonuclease [Gemmataceae bacterium]|nr:Uma2 family endonuclease [Gemmataceae bacterium]